MAEAKSTRCLNEKVLNRKDAETLSQSDGEFNGIRSRARKLWVFASLRFKFLLRIMKNISLCKLIRSNRFSWNDFFRPLNPEFRLKLAECVDEDKGELHEEIPCG